MWCLNQSAYIYGNTLKVIPGWQGFSLSPSLFVANTLQVLLTSMPLELWKACPVLSTSTSLECHRSVPAMRFLCHMLTMYLQVLPWVIFCVVVIVWLLSALKSQYECLFNVKATTFDSKCILSITEILFQCFWFYLFLFFSAYEQFCSVDHCHWWIRNLCNFQVWPFHKWPWKCFMSASGTSCIHYCYSI